MTSQRTVSKKQIDELLEIEQKYLIRKSRARRRARTWFAHGPSEAYLWSP